MSFLLRLLFTISVSTVCLLTHAAEITIGVAGPLSGAYAAFGEQLLKGAEQAVVDLNQAGGINGKKIKLVKYDDACEPKQAVAVANRAIDRDGVTAIVGHFCSSSTIPASDIYAEEGVMMITPASTNPQVTDRGLKTVFRTCGRDDQQGMIAANFIANTLKDQRIAVIHDKDTYGKGLADATRAALEKFNKSIVLYEGITRGEKDYNALVTKLKDVEVDAVYFGGLHTEAGPLVRQMREQGINVPFISGDGIVSEDFVTAAGGKQFLRNVFMTFGKDPRKIASGEALVQRFRAQDYEPEGYTLYAYASVQAIAEAMRQTNSIDGIIISRWLHKNPVNTVMGLKAWDEKGDLTETDYVVYTWNKQGGYNEFKATQTH